MRIYILRHAIAEDSAKGGDAKRALTDEGRKKMKDAAFGFAQLKPEIDVIFSSPLVRAIQTAEIVARAIEYSDEIETMEQLSPGYGPDAAASRVASLKKFQSVMLSGHEPNCSQLVSF